MYADTFNCYNMAVQHVDTLSYINMTAIYMVLNYDNYSVGINRLSIENYEKVFFRQYLK